MTGPLITDAALWNEARERAARIGWDDRDRICRETVSHVCRRLKVTDDAGRDDLRGRLDRLWSERMTIWGAC